MLDMDFLLEILDFMGQCSIAAQTGKYIQSREPRNCDYRPNCVTE